MYKDFERRVLEGTTEFYRMESEKSIQKWLIEEHHFIGYMQHVQKRLDEEILRAKLFHGTTELTMRQVCVDALVTNHMNIFDDEFRVR